MTDIAISRRARNELREIWQYIARDSERAADNLLLAIDEKIELLRVVPELGVRRDDIRSNARMLVHGNYLVLYEYHHVDDLVEIVSVVHGARDLGSLF